MMCNARLVLLFRKCTTVYYRGKLIVYDNKKQSTCMHGPQEVAHERGERTEGGERKKKKEF
jgi:hypothetical protein